MAQGEEFIFPESAAPGAPLLLELAGVSHCTANYRIQRENCALCVLEYVESGTGTLIIDGRVCHPHAGDFYWIPPFTVHRYWSDAQHPWVKYWFNFAGPLASLMLTQYHMEDGGRIPGFSRRELFLDGLAELRELPGDRQRRATGIFSEILFEAARLRGEQQQQKELPHPGCLRVRNYLEQHLREPSPPLTELAALANLPPPRLLERFKQDFGMPPIQYLLSRKMEAAAGLLQNSSLSIKSVAAALGFTDPYYFSTLFRRKCGISPAHFRKKT